MSILRAITLLRCAIFLSIIGHPGICQADSHGVLVRNSRLVALAAARFPNLSSAERAMLWFSDIENVGRGEFAVAGTSALPTAPSNDPARADQWRASRQIRALLIRWMCVDHEALGLIDPKGIRIMGARIIGVLDLSLVTVPIPVALLNCRFTDLVNLVGMEIPDLELDGSYAAEIHASGLTVRNNLAMGKKFHSVGPIFLDHAKIGLDLDCGSANLQYSKNPREPFLDRLKVTLFAYLIQVGGNVWLNRGFESHGAVDLGGARIGGNLHFDSGHFINPDNVAISSPGASVEGVVYLTGWASDGEIEIIGVANFSFDRIADSFIVDHAKFLGAPSDQHGFVGTGMSVARAFIWREVTLQNGAQLDLSNAAVGLLMDDEKSWPLPGKLLLDGFSYDSLSSENEPPNDKLTRDAPGDRNAVESRLRWLALQPPGFHSQPYSELARYYAGSGEDASAVTIFIAQEDDRYRRLGLFGRLWGGFLKATIGYGRKPLLAFDWSILVVLVGWAAVLMGKRAGVMRLTWPENSLPPSGNQTNGLHPLLYSLDVFLPFVNLHQEHYWWPDEAVKGDCVIAGRHIAVHGSTLRAYLWLQIIAGWLLSAIFLAGVTGLIKNK